MGLRKLSEIKIPSKFAACSQCKEVFEDDLTMHGSLIHCPTCTIEGQDPRMPVVGQCLYRGFQSQADAERFLRGE